jgi:hypothetical protein
MAKQGWRTGPIIGPALVASPAVQVVSRKPVPRSSPDSGRPLTGKVPAAGAAWKTGFRECPLRILGVQLTLVTQLEEQGWEVLQMQWDPVF